MKPKTRQAISEVLDMLVPSRITDRAWKRVGEQRNEAVTLLRKHGSSERNHYFWCREVEEFLEKVDHVDKKA